MRKWEIEKRKKGDERQALQGGKERRESEKE